MPMKLLLFLLGLIGGIGITAMIVYFAFKPACATYTTYQQASETLKKVPFFGGDK